jgi:hypothetical protein
MSAPARDHLRGWLGAPHVQWDAGAASVLDGSATGRSAARRPRPVLAATLGIVLPVAIAAASLWLAYERRAERAIAGAPGYHRPSGPQRLGSPLRA